MGNHGVVGHGISRQPTVPVGCGPFFGGDHVGTVWGIGRDHGEEGFPLSLALGHPVAGSVHEDIGAVAVGLFKAATIPEGWVVVLVAWGITAASRESLPNAAAAVN